MPLDHTSMEAVVLTYFTAARRQHALLNNHQTFVHLLAIKMLKHAFGQDNVTRVCQLKSKIAMHLAKPTAVILTHEQS